MWSDFTVRQTAFTMNFMTLQRPTFEELERRRQVREHLSPQRSTTLQRRESMLSRGINAIMRRQSFMGGSGSAVKPNLRRNDSFFMHSSLLSKEQDSMPPMSSMMITPDDHQHPPLHTIVNSANNRPTRSNLGRAKSFKYPERISQIPPAELTRIRSKSQVRNSNFHEAVLCSSEDQVYTSGSGSGSAAGSGKSLLKRNTSYLEKRPPLNRSHFSGEGYNWLNRDLFHNQQMTPRLLPKPGMHRPSPRDISEPPPVAKRRLPLPDIFYYGERWTEQESRSVFNAGRNDANQNYMQQQEIPEPPPGSIEINNNNR